MTDVAEKTGASQASGYPIAGLRTSFCSCSDVDTETEFKPHISFVMLNHFRTNEYWECWLEFETDSAH